MNTLNTRTEHFGVFNGVFRGDTLPRRLHLCLCCPLYEFTAMSHFWLIIVFISFSSFNAFLQTDYGCWISFIQCTNKFHVIVKWKRQTVQLNSEGVSLFWLLWAELVCMKEPSSMLCKCYASLSIRASSVHGYLEQYPISERHLWLNSNIRYTSQ